MKGHDPAQNSQGEFSRDAYAPITAGTSYGVSRVRGENNMVRLRASLRRLL